MKRTLLRILKWAGIVLGSLVGLLVLVSVLLILTNPGPRSSAGWERHADMPAPRGETASAVAGGRLYIAGGFRGLGSTSKSVHVYSPLSDEWVTAPRLPAARHHAAAAGLDRILYLSGGASSAFNWTPLDNLWVLHPDADAWEVLEPMPEGRQGHAMAALDGALYVVGGVGDTSQVLIYEPGEGWRAGAEMPEPRDHLRAVAVDGEVWAIGGRNGRALERVDIYDPEADLWRRGPDLPEPMSAMAVGVLGGEVHVIGGEDPRPVRGHVIETHYSTRPGDDAWEERPRPVLDVHGAGYGVAGERLYIAGGSRRQGPLSPLGWTGLTQSFSPPAADAADDPLDDVLDDMDEVDDPDVEIEE